MEKKYCTAVVLAGGSGKRMGTKVHKQYLMLKGYPVLYYSLKAFQDSSWIDEIVLVSGTGEEEYCQKRNRRKNTVFQKLRQNCNQEEQSDIILSGMVCSRSQKKTGSYIFMTGQDRLWMMR